jgi:hypothetical protein
MNARNVAVALGAIVGLTATLSAQPPKVQAETVTITGCVAQGVDADHYRLSNAVRRQDPPASAAKAGTSRTTRSDNKGASDRTGAYDLQGGEFKAHLGHQVEVTGTSVIAAAKIADETAGLSGAEKTPLPRFNVLSVKMISATCS